MKKARSKKVEHAQASEREPLLVTVAEAARLLSLARLTVYRMLDRGELTRIQLGGRVAIQLSEIHELIRKSAQPPRAAAGDVQSRGMVLRRRKKE